MNFEKPKKLINRTKGINLENIKHENVKDSLINTNLTEIT